MSLKYYSERHLYFKTLKTLKTSKHVTRIKTAKRSGPTRTVCGVVYSLMVGFMSTTALLSMWISNTATAAMMMPVASGRVDWGEHVGPSTPLLLEVAPEIDTNPTSFCRGRPPDPCYRLALRARHVCPPHIFLTCPSLTPCCASSPLIAITHQLLKPLSRRPPVHRLMCTPPLIQVLNTGTLLEVTATTFFIIIIIISSVNAVDKTQP